jgi:DNA-binding CsgD family transcriptional regulator
MATPVAVSENDLRAMLRIVSDHRGDLPSAGLPPSLLAELMDLVRCDDLEFVGQDTHCQTAWFDQFLPAGTGDGGPEDQVYWAHYWDSPCSYPDRSGDVRSVTMVSDFCSTRQWHSTGMYNDYVRLWGAEHEILLCLPAGHMRTARLILSRGPGQDFTERDRALLILLRPHLHQAYLEAEHRRRPTLQLTPRHWELLRLVAAGYTNAQIARRLGVTEKTVGKHLENIYTRLQVSSRTAAVARAFPDGATQAATASRQMPTNRSP